MCTFHIFSVYILDTAYRSGLNEVLRAIKKELNQNLHASDYFLESNKGNPRQKGRDSNLRTRNNNTILRNIFLSAPSMHVGTFLKERCLSVSLAFVLYFKLA